MSNMEYSIELEMARRSKIRELETANKKKKALDDLFTSEKISQSTYDYIDKELTKTITDIEADLKSVTDKMTARAEELEEQLKSLELFFANFEIRHAAGEIDDEMYGNQNKAILSSLEAARQEFDNVKGVLLETLSETIEPSAPTTPETIEAEEPQVEETSPDELMEPIEPSKDVEREESIVKPVESEVPSFIAFSKDISEQPSEETEATTEY